MNPSPGHALLARNELIEEERMNEWNPRIGNGDSVA